MKLSILIVLNSILFLVVANFSIYQKETLLKSPITVILALAPVDPRSLIQGDYMQIRYAASIKIEEQNKLSDGFMLVKKDRSGVHQFLAVRGLEENFQNNEIKIRFRKRGGSARIGSESFFFQEGDSGFYEKAKYGLLKVSPEGETLLIGLLDESQNLITPKKSNRPLKIEN